MVLTSVKKNDCYLTPIGKKVTLTKWIRSEEELLKIYEEVRSRKNPKHRYYLGDYINLFVMGNQRRTVEAMKEMRIELNQTTNTK